MWLGVPQNTTAFSFQFYGGTTSVVQIDGTGNLSTAGAITVGTSGTIIGSQMITFPSVTNAWPSFNTTSAGTRILLWNQTSSTNTNYAIGMYLGTVWFSVPQFNNSSYSWQFVAGTTSVCTIDASGNLWTQGFVFPASTSFNTPTFNTYSSGIRYNIANSPTSTSANYAIGASTNAMWFSVANNVSTQYFNFYGGTTLVSTIDGVGNFTTAGVVVSGNYYNCTSGNLNPPVLNAVSTGTRYILWNNINSTSTNYAIGMAGNTFWLSLPSNVSTQCWAFYGGATIVATIDGVGNFRGASWGTYSDIRLKENIVNARGYLQDLNKLRVVKYDMKASKGERQLGLIAQEVEEIFPGLVETSDKTYHGVKNTKLIKYSVLSVMMLKSIQELTQKIEDLENTVKELRAK